MSQDNYRKGIHVSLLKSTHRELKIKLIKKGLTFQETFEAVAIKIIEDDQLMEKIINEIINTKKSKTLSKFAKSDAESVYDAIESFNPFDKKKEGK